MVDTFDYPVRDPADWGRVGRLPLLKRLALRLRNGRYRRRAPKTDGIELIAAGPERPLGADDLPLVCTVRNAAPTLPAFLRHYRRLGVTRFLFVDDRSDDGTAELLGAQADVDLFRSNVPYAKSHFGRVWRDMLYARFGRRRWYVNVDADEFLLFPGCETRPLRDFIHDLEREGLLRALAPMLDLYPDGPLREAVFDPERHRTPMAVSGLVDGAGYTMRAEKFCLSLRGGPRRRLFGMENRLTKFPVIFVDERTQENGASIHGPMPIWRNFAAPTAVLLHYKFSSVSVEEFRRLIAEGQHFGGGLYYRQIADDPSFNADLSLADAESLAVTDSLDLTRRGFMLDLRQAGI